MHNYIEWQQYIKSCLKNAAKYTCPRCNCGYCSSECYKCTAHAQCSEGFYRDCFMGGLKDMQSSNEEKKKMIEMLERLEEQYKDDETRSDSGDDESDLAERLQGISLDTVATETVWQRLTKEERRQFETMLRDGSLASLIEHWEPWWTIKESLIQDTSDDGGTEDQQRIPRILSDVPPLDHMLRGCLELCGGLSTDTYDSASAAIHGCLQQLQTQAKSLFVSMEFSVAVIKDVTSLLTDSRSAPLCYLLAALSDCHALFRAARKQLGKEIKDSKKAEVATEHEAGVLRRQFHHAQKKLEFFVSWTHKFGLALQPLTTDLEIEFCRLSSDLTRQETLKTRIEGLWGGKRPPPTPCLVEELTDSYVRQKSHLCMKAALNTYKWL
ncbi:hypothetical protein NP493_1683g00001 [Ridgeia piscesae]|uniref:HIT-type domain-containing protein n=1 Tax=Ridgeia piscesae TaxID=27915 RepID=A0AAD9N902_RIDPI|nr:hypothetical protein NP493_1683g00001 [Ridgeia piscesae]